MKPNTEILRKALYELKHLHGITLQEATKQSDVHNLQKIIDGKIEPTPNSWWKLHAAYPKEIPEPSYIDGTRIYKNITADNNSNAAGKSIFNMNQGVSLSASEQALIDGLRKLGEKKDETIFEFLGMISKMLKNQ